ncbi:hypothetical protein DKT74_02185 [Streptomyces sp. ZEA17I]|uniref:hypothetical protein n=1 Tax=Streptomyces sp. ZEA17I TaxID=2202516 RepID=UPI000D6F41D6|nr:hypothetical protein [Streptomyces sp. ZEA17I]PWS48764.1 hypothetical protein DKT74_02185 [Streptomyces sp. ZEA17I]
MSVGGAGIPRLQELTYIESAALAVAGGEPFERIRLAILDRAEELARGTQHDGSFDPAKWHRRRTDPMSYVHNTVDVLKELMRLGWVERHVLPSSPRSAYAHADVTYEATPSGLAWAELVRHDRLGGYNALVGALLNAHPQFEGYLRLVGARPDSTTGHLTVPLLRNDGPSGSSHERYLTAFVSHVTDASRAGDLGWSAPPDVIEESLRGYVTRAVQRAEARAEQLRAEQLRAKERHAKQRSAAGAGVRARVGAETRPDEPPVSRKRFITLCEEAAVRLSFASAGCPMDYISHELLRRWTRFLGLANFSYYAPGPTALRLWATGRVDGSGDRLDFQRRVGREVRAAALQALPQIWSTPDGHLDDASYHPVWRIRAAVCWKLRISDDEFDAAIDAAYRGEFPDLGFRVHLDEAIQLRAPGSVRPLVLRHSTGHHRVFHVMSLFGAHNNEEALTS